MTSIIVTINGTSFTGRLTSPPGRFFVVQMQALAEMLTKFTDLTVTITWR